MLFKRTVFVIVLLFAAASSFAASIKIEADPSRIDTHRDNRVAVDIKLSDDSGDGSAGKEISIGSNYGTFSEIEDLGKGDYRVVLTAPARPPPRRPGYVLVVAAAELEDETPAAGAKIPVYSTLDMRGQSAAGAGVCARAWGRVQGREVVADEKGIFKLSVPVAPGMNSIEIVAKKGGSEKINMVDLKLPARTWFSVLATPETLETEDATGLVFIYALDRKGKPLEAPRFRLDCTPGFCSDAKPVEKGLFAARYHPPRPFRTDRAEVRVGYDGKTQLAWFKLVSPGLASLDIEAETQEAFAGEEIAFDITGRDASGALAEASAVGLFVDGGRVGGAVEGVGGRYRAKYKVRREDAGKTLAFAAEGSPENAPEKVVRSREIMIHIKQPEIELTVERADAQVGPGAAAEIEIRAADSAGGGVAGLNLNATPEAGRVDAVRDAGRGRYTVAFTAPGEWAGSTLRVDIAVSDVPGVSPVSHVFSWGAAVSQEEEGASGEPSLLTLAASPARASPGDKVALTAELKDENAGGVSGQVVKFTTGLGVTGTFADSGGGDYTAELILPETAEPGPAKIEAACECGQKQLTAEAQIEITVPEAASIEITADSTEVYVPDTSESRIEVVVKDESGNGVADQQISLEFKQGGRTDTATVESGPDGRADSTFELSTEAGEAVATAFLKDNTSVRDSVTIRKLRYAVSRIELKAAGDSLPADGATTMEIEVLAINEAGSDAAGERIDFNLLQGGGRLNLTYCTTSDDGRCYVYYTAGLACGDVEVEAFSYSDDTVRQKVTFSETAKVPASLEPAAEPADMTANGTDTQEIQVLARDAGGCPISGERLTFEVSSGPGSIEPEAVTDENGVATAILTAGDTAGTTSILVRSETSPLVMLTFDIEMFSPQALASFAISTSTTSPVAGQPFTVTLTAKDDAGRTFTLYDPAGTTFEFRNPGAAPDGTQPDYPSSDEIASAFSSGVATVQVTLYKAEQTTLAFYGGSLSVTGSAITVSAGAADSIAVASGNNQSAKFSTAVPEPLVVSVTDAYGNPVSGAAVTFEVSSGGGSVSGATQTTDANGQASPDSWTLGPEEGVNTLSASIDSGSVTSVTFTANAFLNDPPTAVITVESASTDVCIGDSVDLSGTGSSAVAPATITSYSWDFDGDGVEDLAVADPPAYIPNVAGQYNVTLSVVDSNALRATDTTTVNVTAGVGPLTLVASPLTIDADGTDTSTISSGVITGCGGTAIADGTLFTVSTTLGSITEGAQIASSDGAISFTLQAGTVEDTATVTATSVDGNYTDSVTVEIGTDSTRPFVISFSPTGYQTENVSLITIVFSEAMDESKVTSPGIFTVKQDGNIAGTRAYDSGSFTLTFTPDEPIDVSEDKVEVKVKKAATDLAGNNLDGKYEGDGDDFEFKFGDVGDQTPPTAVCDEAAPDPFSPDGDSQSDTTTIQFTVSDNDELRYWMLAISSGGTTIRTYAGEAEDESEDLSQDWDGRNQAGEIVANGIYVYEVTAYDDSYNESAACSGTVEVANPISFGRVAP